MTAHNIFTLLPIPGLSTRFRSALLTLIAFAYIGTALHLNGSDSGSTYPAIALLPVILASLSFGVYGAIASALIASIMVACLISGDSNFSMDLKARSAIYLALGLMVAIPVHVQTYYRRKLNHLLTHDIGTGLPSRAALLTALDEALLVNRKAHDSYSLAVVMIGNLHAITSTFGYAAADTLIKALATLIMPAFGEKAHLYHYQRERLAILFPTPEHGLKTQAQQIEHCFERSITHEDIPIHFVTHNGLVTLNGNVARLVINQAEAAIEFALEHNLQSAIYNERMAHDRKNDLMLLGDLSNAMNSGALQLHYQPKINLSNGQLIGFEALSRWMHPRIGTIAPDRFIALIEKTELIHPFSAWAISQALTAVSGWRENRGDLSIAVNISSHNLASDEFPERIHTLLKQHAIDSQMLELEVTESQIMKDPEQAIAILAELKNIRVVISIDDFGTGYSSLAYLNRLPVTVIKIDKFFTQHMESDLSVLSIVTKTIELAHELNMQVVAEGVETVTQHTILCGLGCDIGQGYFYARPMPENEAREWHPTTPPAIHAS